MLSEEKVESIYIALLETQENGITHSPDSTAGLLVDSVFRAFGTSSEEFRAEIATYKSDPTRWKGFFEAVVKKIERKQDSTTQKAAAR